MTPKAITTPTVSGVGTAEDEQHKGQPDADRQARERLQPLRMEPATFSYIATRAPSGA